MRAKGPNAKVTGKIFKAGCFPGQCNTVIKGDVNFSITINVDAQIPDLLGQLIADPGALFGGGGSGRTVAEPDPDQVGGEGEPASGGGMPG